MDESLQRLRSDDVLVADAAVEEIVAAGGAAGDSLLLLIDDARRDVRAGSIRGLGLLGDARAVSPLMALLSRSLEQPQPDTFDDRYVRILAIQALGRLRAQPARDLLLRAARGDSFERAHAGLALFLLDEDEGKRILAESLADTTLAIRNLTVEGLGESASPEAKALLLKCSEDPSWVVRDSAFRGLRRWTDDAEVRRAYARGAADPSWFVRETVAEATSASGASTSE